jgi:hypothetical protein
MNRVIRVAPITPEDISYYENQLMVASSLREQAHNAEAAARIFIESFVSPIPQPKQSVPGDMWYRQEKFEVVISEDKQHVLLIKSTDL